MVGNMLFCQELDEKIDTTLMFVQEALQPTVNKLSLEKRLQTGGNI